MQAIAPDSGFVQLRQADRADHRQRLVAAVTQMAVAIDQDHVIPTLDELRAIAAMCDEFQLPAEGARVRRWMGLR